MIKNSLGINLGFTRAELTALYFTFVNKDVQFILENKYDNTHKSEALKRLDKRRTNKY